MLRPALVIVAALLAQAVAAQETAYVTDILRLGIHRAADTSDSPFRNLVSGTQLTVLERTTNYARVRTEDGEEGWVRSAFIVTDKPAVLIVDETRAELDAALARAAAAETSMAEAEARVGRMTEELTLKIDAADAVQDTLAGLQEENAGYEALLGRYRGAVPIVWVVGAVVVAFSGGALLGTWWLDRRIRRRFGGHRIY